jgi:hypothetical protein
MDVSFASAEIIAHKNVQTVSHDYVQVGSGTNLGLRDQKGVWNNSFLQKSIVS